MNINFEAKTIEMTKAEAKEAGRFNSEKYIELKEIRSEFPTFRIVTKNAPKKKDTYKGLTYTYMAQYIETHTKSGDVRRTEFAQMSGYVNGVKIAFAETATYGEVKAWFLLRFPEIEEYNNAVGNLRKKIKAENEAKNEAKNETKVLAFPITELVKTENEELENVG